MRDISGLEDQKRDVVMVEFDDGTRLNLNGQAVRRVGLRALIREYAPKYADGAPIPVMQGGRKVGTLSALWHPSDVRRSLMHEPRPGDFRREGDAWIAHPSLGPGDLLHAGVNMINKPAW